MHCAKINSALCCINGALRITHNVQRSLLSWATVIKPHDALGESGLYIFHSEMAIASADRVVYMSRCHLGAINIIPDSLCGD